MVQMLILHVSEHPWDREELHRYSKLGSTARVVLTAILVPVAVFLRYALLVFCARIRQF
jgi:hypothetical protein